MLNKDSELSSLRIPHLPMVIREAFAVYNDHHSDIDHMTVGTLADRARLPVEGVVRRLRAIESMAEASEITPEDLKSLLDKGRKNIFLLDVREPWEFELCHIEGSVLMAKTDLARIFPGLKEIDVVTICHHGVRSLSAAFYLREAGLPRVRSLTGGVDAWSLIVDKAMPRY